MRLVLLAALGILALPAFAQDGGAQDGGAPLSAIDWLSRSVDSASAGAFPSTGEAPVTQDGSTPGITVTPLNAAGGGLSGILSPEATGLPHDLWARSDTETLAALIHEEGRGTLPALTELRIALMLAEAAPPADGRGRDLLLARVDRLLDLGALEAARELLASADLFDPEVFRRWFDVTLLTGTEHEACALLGEQPALAPTLLARVFCFARNGDWNAAALTLNTARALGDVTPAEDMLLTRFLDPEFAAEAGDLLPPSRPSPLTYRLREAVGDVMPTTGLPLAFSHADLRDTVPWRVQLEAAERLARHGALSENVLLGLYTARTPAASGGIWDRAAAVQRLDRAVQAGDAAGVAESLAPAWTAMSEVGLEVPFARLYGTTLAGLGLTGAAGDLAHRIALLSPGFEAAAEARAPASPEEAIWRAVATGQVEGVTAPDAPSAAVLAGFGGAPLPESLATPLAEGRTGEAILRAISAFERGLDGDHAALTAAIAALRAAGQEEAARRAALQFLLLGARR